MQAPLTRDQMYTIAQRAGWQGKALDIAVAVARQESTWIVDNVNVSSGASGLWQVLPSAHPEYDVARLRSDADYNAAAAYKISGGGNTWKPWVAYTSGAYLQYMPGGVMAAAADTGNVTAGTTAVRYTAPAPTAQDARYTQKPFDKRHYRASMSGSKVADGLFLGPTFRGWIANIPTLVQGNDVVVGVSSPTAIAGAVAAAGGATDDNILYFLYNPNTITMTYAAQANMLDNGSLDPSQFNPPQAMNGSTTTIGFQLLFDRRFEVMDGDPLGALTDIRTLERIVGVTVDSPIMLSRPVSVGLSHDLSFQIKAVITSITVTFDLFSSGMVPMRAVVDLQAFRIPTNVNGLNQQAAALVPATAPEVAGPPAPKTSTTAVVGGTTYSPGTHGGLPAGSTAVGGSNVAKPGLDTVLKLPVFNPASGGSF